MPTGTPPNHHIESSPQNKDARAPLPLLFLAADALTFLGRPKEAAGAFCRLERGLLAALGQGGKGGGQQQQEWEGPVLGEGEAVVSGVTSPHRRINVCPIHPTPTTTTTPQWWLHKVRLGLLAALLRDGSWRSALVVLEGMRRVGVCVCVCVC